MTPTELLIRWQAWAREIRPLRDLGNLPTREVMAFDKLRAMTTELVGDWESNGHGAYAQIRESGHSIPEPAEWPRPKSGVDGFPRDVESPTPNKTGRSE